MLNIISIVGRLTADPQYTATQTGKSCCRFTLACQRDFGEKQTDFIECVAWKQTAEFITRHFNKGAMMCVSGRLQINQWEKDGQKRSKPEVVVDNAYFYGDKRSAPSAAPDVPAPDFVVIYDDDAQLPFD